MAQPLENRYSTASVQNVKEAAHEQVDRASSKIEDAAQTLTQQGRDISDNVQTVANNVGDAIKKSLNDQPITTLAMAAAMAFVLGAIWKS